MMMERGEVEAFLGKHVKVTRKDGYFFSGTIESVNGASFSFRDKFGKLMAFAYDSIQTLQEL